MSIRRFLVSQPTWWWEKVAYTLWSHGLVFWTWAPCRATDRLPQCGVQGDLPEGGEPPRFISIKVAQCAPSFLPTPPLSRGSIIESGALPFLENVLAPNQQWWNVLSRTKRRRVLCSMLLCMCFFFFFVLPHPLSKTETYSSVCTEMKNNTLTTFFWCWEMRR